MIKESNKEYDVVIVGGGPAGLSAGLYTARAKLNTRLVERGLPGGQIANAELVENYPGFPDGISGLELANLMHQQATKCGLETLMAEVTGLELGGEQKIVKTTEGDLAAEAVIIASGSERSKLGVPGETEFTGKGVSYCAVCDGALFRDQKVVVVGGGNAAITEALNLTHFADKVTVIHRREELRATRTLQDKALAHPKIEFLWNTVVTEIKGEGIISELKLRNVKTGEESTLNVDGVFVSVGFKPETTYLKGILPLDAAGFIITNERMETEVPGIFAAGDVRANSIRQVVAAAGDGAIAAIYAERLIRE